MKAVVTRVNSASVSIDGAVHGKIGRGFLILLGVGPDDTPALCRKLAEKVLGLRVFRDENDKMNRSVCDINGEMLVISQFTLCADVKKGNRPSFTGAMEPEKANNLYMLYCEELRKNGIKSVETGIFGADMQVSLINDGPVTILFDTDIWRKNGNKSTTPGTD